jgi:hypothetical protein
VSWDQRFFDPIVLSGRKLLVTLRDAAQYITKLPRAEHDAKEWQAAMEALLLVAEHDGPTQFARIGDSESWRGINDPTSENYRSYDPRWRRVERRLVGLATVKPEGVALEGL